MNINIHYILIERYNKYKEVSRDWRISALKPLGPVLEIGYIL